MNMTLIKADGTGRTGVNSYASLEDAAAYFGEGTEAVAWTGASADERRLALVAASRFIDASVAFGGWPAEEGQALAWPRKGCVDLSRLGVTPAVKAWGGESCAPEGAIPQEVVVACCEVALGLVLATARDDGGTKRAAGLGMGGIGLGMGDEFGGEPVIGHVAAALLGRYGVFRGVAAGRVRVVWN